MRQDDPECQRLHSHAPSASLHPIAGGADDSGLLATLRAAVRGVCAECIETQTGLPATQVPLTIARLRQSIHIQTARGRCDVCAEIRTMYRAGPRAIDAIVEFLNQHRGEAFCSACIASRLTRVQEDAARGDLEVASGTPLAPALLPPLAGDDSFEPG